MNGGNLRVYNCVMIAIVPRKCLAILAAVVCCLIVDARVFAHIISIDNVLELTADRDRATAEFMVPIEAMLMWTAGNAGRLTPDKTDDNLAFAKAHGDDVIKGLGLMYGDVEMEPKIISTTTRTVDLGLTEDPTPQPMAVYKLEFTPKRKLVAPPTEISFGHSLLVVPEQYQQVDVTVMCFVHFHQADVKGVKNEAVAPEEHVTFKCKWPSQPTSAPAKSSQGPSAGAMPVVAEVMVTAQPSHALQYALVVAVCISLAAAAGIAAIFMKRRA